MLRRQIVVVVRESIPVRKPARFSPSASLEAAPAACAANAQCSTRTAGSEIVRLRARHRHLNCRKIVQGLLLKPVPLRSRCPGPLRCTSSPAPAFRRISPTDVPPSSPAARRSCPADAPAQSHLPSRSRAPHLQEAQLPEARKRLARERLVELDPVEFSDLLPQPRQQLLASPAPAQCP